LNHRRVVIIRRPSACVKAKRYALCNSDMDDLEGQLKLAREEGARFFIMNRNRCRFPVGWLIWPNCLKSQNWPRIRTGFVMVTNCRDTGLMGPKAEGTPHILGSRW